eukprot:654065-Amphidinium_carterae.1
MLDFPVSNFPLVDAFCSWDSRKKWFRNMLALGSFTCGKDKQTLPCQVLQARPELASNVVAIAVLLVQTLHAARQCSGFRTKLYALSRKRCSSYLMEMIAIPWNWWLYSIPNPEARTVAQGDRFDA